MHPEHLIAAKMKIRVATPRPRPGQLKKEPSSLFGSDCRNSQRRSDMRMVKLARSGRMGAKSSLSEVRGC